MYGSTFGKRKMADILEDISLFLRKTQELGVEDQYTMMNDDLKGFFTSVSPERIRDAVAHLAFAYHASDPGKKGLKAICFSIPQTFNAKTRIIRGKSFSKTSKNLIIFLYDLIAIADLALQQSHFVCMDGVYRQRRGAIIGGHASPVLCAVAVAFQEFLWCKAYDISKSMTRICENSLPKLLCIRYVDNRLSIIQREEMGNRSFARFLDQSFYQHPVELEDCGDNKFLGYEIC